MFNMRKLRLIFTLKCAISNFSVTHIESLETMLRPPLSFHIAQNPRFYRTKRAAQSSHCKGLGASLTANKKSAAKISCSTKRAAQAVLLEYFHSTRGLQFLDADNMCKNSPSFLGELLKKVPKEGDIRESISRYLRYHPINEFEPFFESLGMKPSEYVSLIPPDMMFLSDDELMLENYHVLCNYGIPQNKMGKIFKEATEIFHFDPGVLSSKLQSYEELGLWQSILIKVIASSPCLLIGDINLDVVKVIEKLKNFVKDTDWIEGHLLDEASYNWHQMLELLCFFEKIFGDEQLYEIISQHPDLLFEESGGRTFSLTGFLLKFGLPMNHISVIFMKFPQIRIGKFLSNLRNCFQLLTEIEMEAADIGKIFWSYSLLLGSFTLKRTNSLLANLNVGKKRLCRVIQDNPQEMKNWVLGRRIQRLPIPQERIESHMQKTKFLLNLGYEQNSHEMKRAFKLFKGKGEDLQARFDCFVKAGLDCKDVHEMAKVAPQTFSQTVDVLNRKIRFLVDELGYPVTTLANFPSYLSYTTQRVKLRVSMYNWLKDQGVVDQNVALSTIIPCSDKTFLNQYVNHHPIGPKVWEDLKEKIYAEN